MTLGARLGSAQPSAAPMENAAAASLVDGEGAAPLSSHSRFAQRLRRRYASELALLPTGPLNRTSMDAAYGRLRAQAGDTGTALRMLRQLVLERLITLDCDRQAPLGTITAAV